MDRSPSAESWEVILSGANPVRQGGSQVVQENKGRQQEIPGNSKVQPPRKVTGFGGRLGTIGPPLAGTFRWTELKPWLEERQPKGCIPGIGPERNPGKQFSQGTFGYGDHSTKGKPEFPNQIQRKNPKGTKGRAGWGWRVEKFGPKEGKDLFRAKKERKRSAFGPEEETGKKWSGDLGLLTETFQGQIRRP